MKKQRQTPQRKKADLGIATTKVRELVTDDLESVVGGRGCSQHSADLCPSG